MIDRPHRPNRLLAGRFRLRRVPENQKLFQDRPKDEPECEKSRGCGVIIYQHIFFLTFFQVPLLSGGLYRAKHLPPLKGSSLSRPFSSRQNYPSTAATSFHSPEDSWLLKLLIFYRHDLHKNSAKSKTTFQKCSNVGVKSLCFSHSVRFVTHYSVTFLILVFFGSQHLSFHLV